MSNVIKREAATINQQKLISVRQLLKNNRESTINEHASFVYQEQIELAKREATAIIEQAKLQANSILQEVADQQQTWQAEKVELVEQAKHEGFATGKQLGQETAYEEYRDLVNLAQTIVEKAKADYEKTIFQAEQTILTIGIKAAEKILAHHLEENPTSFIPLVKKAIQEVRECKKIEIQVHPNYYSYLIEAQDELLKGIIPNHEVYIVPSDEINETSCIIETDGGRIDASIHSQLYELREKLLELL